MRTIARRRGARALAGCAGDPNYGGSTRPTPSDRRSHGNDPAQPPAGVVAAGVRWFGRVDTTSNAGQPRFAWSGSGFVARFSGTSLTAELAVTGSAQIFKAVVDGAPQAAFTAAAGQGDAHARRRPGGGHAHRRALPPDGRAAGRDAADGPHRRRRRADGPARRRGPPHRGDRRLDHLRLRQPGHARRHRVLHHREPLGHLRVDRGARARRRGQHDRRVGPRHHPQLRRRHGRHDADGLRRGRSRTWRARSGTSTSSRRWW